MNTETLTRFGLAPSAGLVAPPLLWAANTLAGQILPYVECDAFKITAATSFLAASLSLAVAYVSWRTVQRNPSECSPEGMVSPASLRFVGLLGVLNGALFAFALVLQGASSLVLTGCER
jgi:hypothetical protein